MKISVQKEIGSVLVSKDSAKDLFILVIENHLSEKEDDIELDFTSVVTIGNDFFPSFVSLCGESEVFGIEKLRDMVMFSGLFVADIENLASALAPIRSDVQLKAEEIRERLRKATSSRKETMNPGMTEAFEKIAKMVDGALGNIGKKQ